MPFDPFQSQYATQDVTSQGDRIAELLRQTASKGQSQPSFNNIADSMISAWGNSRNPNAGGGAFNAYKQSMDVAAQQQRQENQDVVGAEKQIYDYMVKAKDMGDREAASIKQGLDTLVGDDPMKQQQIIKYAAEKYPDQKINAGNYLSIAMEAMDNLGLKNDDRVFEKRKQDLTLADLEAGIASKRASAAATTIRAQGGIGGGSSGGMPGLGKEGNKQLDKAKADRISSLKANAEGAQGFLRKVAKIEKTLKELGSDSGPLQGSDTGQLLGGILNTSAQQKRDLLQSQLADLELDVAKMRLKGQGQVTDSERKIARDTLPKQKNNPEPNLAIIGDLKQEATQILQKNEAYNQFGGDIDQFEQQYGGAGLQSIKSKYGLE